MVADPARPTPLRDVARIWSLVGGGIGAVATFLVTNQVITSVQAEAVSNVSASTSLLISAITGLITARTGVISAFSVAKQGESKVTPLSAPRDNEGNVLLPTSPYGGPVAEGGL